MARHDPAADSDEGFPDWYKHVLATRNTRFMYDYVTREGFPTVKQLREGLLLGSIADALWLAANQGSFAGCEWDGDTFVENNEQGELWAVAFTPAGAVAVFYSSESDRNPFPPDGPPYDQGRFFQGMPKTLQPAKERALSLMTNLEWGAGGPTAAVTSAMWADGEQFTANEPWEAVFFNSLYICHRQLLPLNVALVEWKNQYSLTDEEVPVLRSLYLRRVASTKATIPTTRREYAVFTRSGDVAGIEAARTALANVGIRLPADA
jgi:hypothetical protein